MTLTDESGCVAPTRRWVLAVVAACAVGIDAGAARAQDTDDLRFYFGIRVGQGFIEKDPLPGLEIKDPRRNVTGISAGVNFNRYFGVELSGDYMFHTLQVPGMQLGEYGMFSLIPQVRLRYPLLEGRLSPYILGGAGVSFNQFNDQLPEAAGVKVDTQTTGAVFSVGGGIEYFVANNVALGIEAKYLISQDHEIEVEGIVERGKADLDTVLVAGSIRLLFPETPAVHQSDRPYAGRKRLYIGGRMGAAIPVHDEISDGIEWTPSHNEVSSTLGVNRLLGAIVGLNVGDYWGVELVAQGFTPQLALADTGQRFGKFAVYSFIPQLRLRYPLLGGQVSPYFLAGVGFAYGEFTHEKPFGLQVEPVGGNGYAVAASAGLGVDYFVAKNIAVALETNYLYARIPGFFIRGKAQTVNADSVLASLGLRIYFPEGGPLWGK
jgi:opacity protein-like surface antigen